MAHANNGIILLSLSAAVISTVSSWPAYSCVYDRYPRMRCSLPRTAIEEHSEYRTIDQSDIEDPNVGVLQAEDMSDLEQGIETMDLSVLNQDTKPEEAPSPKPEEDSKPEADQSTSEVVQSGPEAEESQVLSHHVQEEVEKTVTIVKNVADPYPVEKTVHYPVIRKVPYPVKVPVVQPYPIEKPVPYPVKVIVKVPTKIPRPVPVYKVVPYPVEVPVVRPVPYTNYVPDPYPVERKVHYEVKIPVPEPFPVEREIPLPIKVPERVIQLYPVEKEVHYPVEVKVEEPYGGYGGYHARWTRQAVKVDESEAPGAVKVESEAGEGVKTGESEVPEEVKVDGFTDKVKMNGFEAPEAVKFNESEAPEAIKRVGSQGGGEREVGEASERGTGSGRVVSETFYSISGRLERDSREGERGKIGRSGFDSGNEKLGGLT